MPENRIDQALDEFRIALSLDPLSSIVNVNYGLTLMVAHRMPESLAQFNKLLERDPTFAPGHYYLSQVYASSGRFTEAVSELQKAGTATGSWSPDAQGYIKLMLAPSNVGAPTNIAVSYAVAGDRNKAFEYLEKAYSEQDSELMACIRFPALDPLRSDPRFKDLMRRLGLPD